MTAFPNMASAGYGNPVEETIKFKNLRSRFADKGVVRVKRKWLFPRRRIVLVYPNLTKVKLATVFQFYIARSGGWESFNFFYEATEQGTTQVYVAEYVGTGDGSTTVWNLPSKSGSAYSIYLDAIEQTGGGTHYTFSQGGGTDGADKVTFTVAPAAGQHITYDFTGYLKVRGKFEDDELTFKQFYDKIARFGLAIQGELNA